MDSGHLELIIGPMFSGKTNLIINKYNDIVHTLKSIDVLYTISDLEINDHLLAINYDKDTRYGENSIISHDGNSIPCLSINKLSDIPFTKLESALYIIINEAQFFKNLKEWVINLIDYKQKHIILCGLDSDFKREKFGDLLDLIPHANTLTKLNGKCSSCCHPSIFTHRISSELEQEVIGTNNYIPLCRNCFIQKTNNIIDKSLTNMNLNL